MTNYIEMPMSISSTKYRFYLIKIIERNTHMNYGLTMLEIRQTAREMYRRDHCTLYGF